MQEMIRQFNDEKVVGNLYSFMGEFRKEYQNQIMFQNTDVNLI